MVHRMCQSYFLVHGLVVTVVAISGEVPILVDHSTGDYYIATDKHITNIKPYRPFDETK